MASVRKIVSVAETNVGTATFFYDASIVYTSSSYDGSNHSAQVGMAVAIVSDQTVGLGTSGNRCIGKLLKVESDGLCTVQVSGGMQLPYDHTNVVNPPLVGRGVQVDGAGNAITVPNGGTRQATERGDVTHLDSTNNLIECIF